MGSSAFLKPPRLRPGDTIGVVAPASGLKVDMPEAGLRERASLGFRTRHEADITEIFRYVAGSRQRRATELVNMIRDRSVDGIFCARGGFGSGHIVGDIDPAMIRDNPKVFCGASDITVLLAAYFGAGVVAFHGPMVATTMRRGREGYDRDLLELWLDPEYVAYRERVHQFAFAPCTKCGGCEISRSNETDCFDVVAPACGGCLWAQGVIQCP